MARSLEVLEKSSRPHDLEPGIVQFRLRRMVLGSAWLACGEAPHFRQTGFALSTVLRLVVICSGNSCPQRRGLRVSRDLDRVNGFRFPACDRDVAPIPSTISVPARSAALTQTASFAGWSYRSAGACHVSLILLHDCFSEVSNER